MNEIAPRVPRLGDCLIWLETLSETTLLHGVPKGHMKHKRFKLVLFLTLSLGGVFAYGQDPLGPSPKKARTLDDYKARSMKEVSARELDETVRLTMKKK